jgi:hypothetical protein
MPENSGVSMTFHGALMGHSWAKNGDFLQHMATNGTFQVIDFSVGWCCGVWDTYNF